MWVRSVLYSYLRYVILIDTGAFVSFVGADTYMIYDPKFTVHNIQHTTYLVVVINRRFPPLYLLVVSTKLYVCRHWY